MRHKKRKMGNYIPWTDPELQECAILAACGLTTKFIIGKTGLTEGQVNYRIRAKTDIHRMDIRNGKGKFGRLMVQAQSEVVREAVLERLKQMAPESHD